MTSVTRFLEKRLKLKVNAAKSAVDLCHRRKFLAYRLGCGGQLHISPESLSLFKNMIRYPTRRNQGKKFEQVIKRLNSCLNGWHTYYQCGCRPSLLKSLNEWVRRKLRCYRLKQCKRAIGISRFLQNLGVPEWQTWFLALSGKCWWRLSLAWQNAVGMRLDWLRKMGLVSLRGKLLR